jgi:wyosine [tRNA(Phe)-imidazoG37] synthetase (radical SAM superfamily)
MLGSSGFLVAERSRLVPVSEFQEDLEALTADERGITMRFMGTGEATLAVDLGEMIQLARGTGVRRIAVMTNSSLLDRAQVREELEGADIIVAKLDSSDEETFQRINRPHVDISYSRMLRGLKAMRSGFRGSMRLQVMVMKENEPAIEDLVRICSGLAPDITYVCTPTRPSPAHPLSHRALVEVGRRFRRAGLKVAIQPRGHPHGGQGEQGQPLE